MQNEMKNPESASDERITRGSLFPKLRALPDRALSLWRIYRSGARTHLKEGAVGLALGLCAYLLGSSELLFGTYPLGIALLSASPKKILWIFAGACASALGLPGNVWLYLFAYATVVTVRVLTRLLVDPPADGDIGDGADKLRRRARAAFTESIYLRMAISCAAAFMVGIYSLVAHGFEYYDLFGTIFSLICTPAAVFVYAGCFEDEKKPLSGDKRALVSLRDVSITALVVSLTYAIRDMSFIGISVGAFFAFFISLYVCRERGILSGAIVGLLVGVAYSPEYAPMFAASAITAGALWNISPSGALVASGGAAMIWGFYVEGISAMSRLLPAIMLSAACYMGAERLSFFPAARDLLFSGRYCSAMNDAAMAVEFAEETERRMAALSQSFGTLSEVFYNLSDRLCRPGLPELRRMCDKVYDRYCPLCPNRELCWELEYSSSKEILTSISEKLASRGHAEDSDLPEYMQKRCPALPGIVGEINYAFAELARATSLSDRTGVFAMDYAAVSELLADALADCRAGYVKDEALTSKLGQVLSAYGFGEGGVSVYGSDAPAPGLPAMKHVVARGLDVSGAGARMTGLKKAIADACGFPVGDPVLEMKDGAVTLRVSTARRFKAEYAVKVSYTGEEECGDVATSFENGEGKFCSLIVDGMGRGREAALTAGICSVFLGRMIGVGNRPATVIKMLNSFLRSKPGECSASVDLAEIDLLNGHIEFSKCGAPASFVRRKNNLFKLASGTIPLGILGATDVGRLTFNAEAGDVIIMMSDGVCQGSPGTAGGDECIWLLDMLSTEWENDIGKMAEKIASRARAAGSHDDVSVALIRIDEESRE